MFCTSCGVAIPETARIFAFAAGRGAAAAPAATCADPSPAPPIAARRIRPQPVHVRASHPARTAGPTCPWCASVIDAAAVELPALRRDVQRSADVSESGWAQFPGRKDMAKLQFGDSFCQIEGLYVPVADMNLAPGDSVYFTHHVLLWKDPQVNITAMSLNGAWKRMFAGMPLVMTQAQGPGPHRVFARRARRADRAAAAARRQPSTCASICFLLATGNVAYDWFQTNIWLQHASTATTPETHYPMGMFMDRFTAPAISRAAPAARRGQRASCASWRPARRILVKPTALIFKDPTVEMHLHFEHPGTIFSGWGSWGNRYMWLRLMGPGRVAVQSVFERIEGENAYLTSSSPATQQQW